MPPHVLMNFCGFLPGCGDSVADFWGWDAHGVRLCCSDDVNGDMQEDEISGEALSLNLLTTQNHGHHGNLSLQGKIPMLEPGIKPRTSWLVVRDLDHWTTRLVFPGKTGFLIFLFSKTSPVILTFPSFYTVDVLHIYDCFGYTLSKMEVLKSSTHYSPFPWTHVTDSLKSLWSSV